MNWDEEIDFLAGKKSAPKQGRRSSNTLLSPRDEEEEVIETSGESNPTVPLRTRKTGVWGEEPPKSSKSKSESNIIEMERFQNEKTEEFEDDIPVIPDIDDLQEDPLNLPDVKPIVSVDKLTYKELDNQFDNFQIEQANFGNLGELDLSFLTNKLYPEKEVQSTTDIWTLESLFNELSRSST